MAEAPVSFLKKISSIYIFQLTLWWWNAAKINHFSTDKSV